MEDYIDPPVDLYLYRRSPAVDTEEAWKWRWEIWDPVIEQLYSVREAAKKVPCPVCGKASLYTVYLASHLKKDSSKHLVFIGDRFFGCFSCQIQKRDYGETPVWLDEKEAYWASKRCKQAAEAELGRKLNGPIVR